MRRRLELPRDRATQELLRGDESRETQCSGLLAKEPDVLVYARPLDDAFAAIAVVAFLARREALSRRSWSARGQAAQLVGARRAATR